jgi:hypothetical protein
VLGCPGIVVATPKRIEEFDRPAASNGVARMAGSKSIASESSRSVT